MATIRLPSGEMRRVRAECMATVGQVGNLEHENLNIGKAGRSRHMGRRPQVRGVGDESGRPPARWRRGQGADRHAARRRRGASRRWASAPASASSTGNKLIVRRRMDEVRRTR